MINCKFADLLIDESVFSLPLGPGVDVEIAEECASTGVINRITYRGDGKKEVVIWDSTMGIPEPKLEHSAFGFRLVFPVESLEPGCQLNELFANEVSR